MEVRYVNSSLANNFGTHIELNENLKQYPELHDAILQHELSHTNKEGFTKEDFLLDIGPSKIDNWKLFKFMVRHPKSLLQLAPIYRKDGFFVYDLNMIIVSVVLCLVIGLSIFLVI